MHAQISPIETLMAEHQIILKTLDALEVYARRLQSGHDAAPDDLGRFATFLRDFADSLHHGKEEDQLFAAMIESGIPRDVGPIAVMLGEHDEGRGYVKVMRELGDKGELTAAERHAAGQNALAFCELLRAHIRKEDGILYPMAESRLSDAAMEKVAESCHALDLARAEDIASLVATSQRLVERYADAGPEADCSQSCDDEYPSCSCGH